MGVGVVLFVLERADQHLLEEDLVEEAFLGRRGFGVGGVAVGGQCEGSFEEGVLLHVVAFEGLEAAFDLGQALLQLLLLSGHQLHR